MSKPLVSISLLCSNRKNTIRNCLDSLQPLRDVVSTELVIVDTGCDEETRAILEEYADQIVDFEWCNDFAKARNAGLEKCHGEWFLFIDDDEWFIDMDEIIEFFLSGRYHEYHHASYIQRNYSDYKELVYQDAWISRMVRIEKDTKFVSCIHEHYTPAIGEPALLHSIVKHFGYIYDSEEERYKHCERNTSLLWEMVKRERDNIRWWMHLIPEYLTIEEYSKLIEVANEALRIFRKSNRIGIVRDKAVLYLGRICAAEGLHQISKAKEFYEDAIADPNLLPAAKGALDQAGARIYYRLGDFEKCKKCGQRYIKVYEQCIKDELELCRQSAPLLIDAFEEKTYGIILSVLISVYLKEGNFESVISCFRKINWGSDKIKVHEKCIPDIVESFTKYECNDVLVEMAQTLMKYQQIGQATISEIQKTENLEQIAEVFSHVESEHYYVWYLKILHADQIHDSTHLQEYYEKLFSGVRDALNFDDKIWNIAKSYQLNLEAIIMDIPFDRWKAGVDWLCKSNELEVIQKRYEDIQDLKQTSNIRYDYFELKVSEMIAVYDGKDFAQNETESNNGTGADNDYDACRAKIRDFAEKSLLFYQKFYTETAFEGEMEMLPASCRAAVKLSDALAKEESGDYKKVLEELKGIIGVYSPLDSMIQKYSKLYGKRVVEQQSASKVSPEMLELAKKLTEKAEELMAVGDVANAEMILKQVSIYLRR